MISYQDFFKSQHTHYLMLYEIPEEHAKSLPLPTLRWGRPAYASFASPALMIPGKPMEQDVPDRWWVIDAVSGRLLIYARMDIFPFKRDKSWKTVILPLIKRTLEEQKTLFEQVKEKMNDSAGYFFSNEAVQPETKRALRKILRSSIPAPLWSQYKALTPDFFTWLNKV